MFEISPWKKYLATGCSDLIAQQDAVVHTSAKFDWFESFLVDHT